MEELQVRRLKILLLISSLACLVLMVLAAFEENLAGGWRAAQLRYAHLLKDNTRAAGQSANLRPAGYPIEVRQVFLKDWNRVDRCVSCHVGIENPKFRDAEQPLTAHPGSLLQSHAVERYGCTICHQGQGRATDKEGAHGRVPFWNQPLLVGELVQSSCAKCHHQDEVPQAPILNHGQHLVSILGCAGCHRLGPEAPPAKVGPPLSRTGSKVTPRWLAAWLANPKSYLTKAKMPRYDLPREAVDSLSAYLMKFRDPAIDSMPEPAGDHDAGNTIYREAQCIVCHVTKEDIQGNPVGGTLGPDLRKIGNKVGARWLVAFLKNPHAHWPNTQMPRYNFNDEQAADLAAFIVEEWVDLDLKDKEAEEPVPPPDSPQRIRQGELLFKELGCAGCHDLLPDDAQLSGPDLSQIGGKQVHEFDFGGADIRRTTLDFLYTKLKSPKAFRQDSQLPTWEKPAAEIWQNLRPAALFSDVMSLPDGTDSQQLQWILTSAEHAGVLEAGLQLPDRSPKKQAEWLTEKFNAVGALSQLKMPNFELTNDDLEGLTVVLMSRSAMSLPSKQYEVVQPPKLAFDPMDGFGTLQRRYRCLSCHTVRGSGNRQASDLTYEGSRVHRNWLSHYLNTPYSMRRTLSIAMPIFHFSDEESQFMAEYMSLVFVDTRLDADWELERDRADAERGKELFDAKGCIACHQLHGKGGDVGPSLSTQVPEFPQGTWVGDKLKGGWIYRWLRNPQSLVSDTLEPNLGLSDQEALDLTAYLLTLKNPDVQESK
jgi:mono/diheme cytochrome c family protein